MSIEAQTVEYTYVGDGATTRFPFPSKFLSPGDIRVGLDGVEQIGGFTAVGAGDDAGGYISFPAAPAVGVVVLLLREPPMSQLVDFINGQTILEGVLDNALDKLTMISQYLRRVFNRTLRLSDFDRSTPGTIPDAATRAGKVMGFDIDGKLVLLSPSETGVLDPGVANSIIIKNPVSALTVVRSLNHWKSEGLSLFDMDSRAGLRDGVLDATVSMQRLAAECAALGFVGRVPAGKFAIADTITFDEMNSAVVADGRGSLRGEGVAQTEIKAQDGVYPALRFIGATTGGVGLGIKPGGFLLTQPNRTGTGISFEQYAFANIDDIFIHGFDLGLSAEDCLSFAVRDLTLRENNRGIFARRGDFSAPNAWTLDNVELGSNREYGALFEQPSTLNWTGGAVQGNGVGGIGPTEQRGGVFITNAGKEGAVGLTIAGVYFEVNAGNADLSIASTLYSSTYAIKACNFARLLDTDFVNYNVYVNIGGTAVGVVGIQNCGFKGYGSYVESPSRPYVGVFSINGQVIDEGGNLWAGTTAYTDLVAVGPGARAGTIQADGTVTTLPFAWTFSKTGTGLYEVIHNLGTTNYSVIAVSIDGNPRVVQRVSKAATNFTVVTTDLSGTLADCAFDFVLTR